MSQDTIIIFTTQRLRFLKKRSDRPAEANDAIVPNTDFVWHTTGIGKPESAPAWIQDDPMFALATRPHPVTGEVALRVYQDVPQFQAHPEQKFFNPNALTPENAQIIPPDGALEPEDVKNRAKERRSNNKKEDGKDRPNNPVDGPEQS